MFGASALVAKRGLAHVDPQAGATLSINGGHAEARRLFRLAADQGYVAGQRNLADSYYLGRGGSQSYPDALTWYGRAAEQGPVRKRRKKKPEVAKAAVTKSQNRKPKRR